jgi:hypothetical protein
VLASLQAAGLMSATWRPVAAYAAFGQTPFYLTLLISEYVVRRRYLNHLDHMSFFEFLRFLRRIDYTAALRN